MVKMKKIFFCLLLFLLSPLVYAAANKPTLLLVHGALFTSSGWYEVQSHLQNDGYNVVTLDVPGRANDGIAATDVTLSLAAEKVCKVAELQRGKVVLVGHSQAGAIITKAIDKCANKIKALVYLAAVVPLNGEKAFDSLSGNDQINFEKAATFDEKNLIFRINYSGPIKEVLMADANSAQYDRALHSMVDEPANIGDEVLNYPVNLFVAIPKFYIETTEDQIISISTQRKLQSKIVFNKIYTMHSSHSPFVSHAKELANNLEDIVAHL